MATIPDIWLKLNTLSKNTNSEKYWILLVKMFYQYLQKRQFYRNIEFVINTNVNIRKFAYSIYQNYFSLI